MGSGAIGGRADRCRAASGPQDGWICASLGVRVPAPRLTLTAKSNEPRTTLRDRPREPARGCAACAGCRRDGALLAIQAGERTEWITAAGVGEGPRIETDALLAICRHGRIAAIVEQAVAAARRCVSILTD